MKASMKVRSKESKAMRTRTNIIVKKAMAYSVSYDRPKLKLNVNVCIKISAGKYRVYGRSLLPG